MCHHLRSNSAGTIVRDGSCASGEQSGWDGSRGGWKWWLGQAPRLRKLRCQPRLLGNKEVDEDWTDSGVRVDETSKEHNGRLDESIKSKESDPCSHSHLAYRHYISVMLAGRKRF